MPQPLECFFGELVPFLRLERGVEDVSRTLGPSASGSARFAFYQTLMRRDLASILSNLFPALARVADRVRPGLWKEIVRSYSAAHAPRHWDPNRFGEGLSDWLSARRAADAALPEFLEEIADFSFLEYVVGVAPDADPSDIGFDRVLFVRQYAHDIPRFVRALERDPMAPEPRSEPTNVIVYRDCESLRARVFYPTTAGLLALARRRGLETSVPAALTALVERADRDLVRHGILPDAVSTVTSACLGRR